MNENKSYKNMELKFNKNGDAWVAEFEATDKFNLHMEGLLLGSFSILQRTAGGKYTHVRDIPTYPRFDKVFDYDFDALVYPKFIKIVSETEPTYAEVVSDGEITEIKSQTKEVEVTANGTTQVAPDAGYSYLTGVTVKTNVPQSGGSGGEESHAEYYSIDWEKAKEVGWVSDTHDNIPANVVSVFANCESAVSLYQGMTLIAKISDIITTFLEQQMSIGSMIKTFAKVKFIPTSIKIAQNGSVVHQEELNTLSDVYPGLNTQGIMTSITKEEFYTI
jgi:hypothetical protein